eukprot:9485876-Pyramimonas_sp.AAC.1
MATASFTKEVTRFTIQLKKECLEEVLSTVTENNCMPVSSPGISTDEPEYTYMIRDAIIVILMHV